MSMSRTYSKGRCGVCGALITRAGFAMAAHLRRHVREGKMEERTNFMAEVEFRTIAVPDAEWGKSTQFF